MKEETMPGRCSPRYGYSQLDLEHLREDFFSAFEFYYNRGFDWVVEFIVRIFACDAD